MTPSKTNPPLVVNADRPLILTVTPQLLQAVAGRIAHIFQLFSGVQQLQLARPLFIPNPFSFLVSKAADHAVSITSLVI
jgi:hypothetical protein